MKNTTKLLAAGALTLGLAPEGARGGSGDAAPNLVLITLDDMNWDSVGAYGSEVPGITPHMDRLAHEGMRFQHAYIQTPACSPSRNVLTTGRYPHTSGVTGFFNVVADYQTLPEALRDRGYLTGVINKPRDSSPNDDYDRFWDHHLILTNDVKREAEHYAAPLDAFLDRASEHGGPFFCVVNVADPHKPFYGDPKADEKGSGVVPSRVYSPSDVPIPDSLPEHPDIRQEMANYYNSVRRGDDCVGAVLKVLEARGVMDDAVIMLLSDHGMPLPFAKSMLYREGVRTP